MDRSAAGLSTLCVLHCLIGSAALVLFVPLAPLLGHGVHAVGLAIAALLAALALGRGWQRHRNPEPATLGAAGICLMALGLAVGHGGVSEFALTATGALVVAVAHLMNGRARRAF